MQIKEPVEDSKGFVYERKSIEDYIRGKPGGATVAPSMGNFFRYHLSMCASILSR